MDLHTLNSNKFHPRKRDMHNRKLSVLLLLVSSLVFAIDRSELIKVTQQTNPACVEYYNLQGDMYCSTRALNPSVKVNLADEKQKIMFDNRLWQAVWSKKNSKITTIEYVPAGDNINNWKELITSDFIPSRSKKLSPAEYMYAFLLDLQKAGFKPLVTLLYRTLDEIIFEFRIEEPSHMQQDEIQKIVTEKDGLYILHYVIKKADMGKDEQKKWINLLKQSKIKGS